MPNDYNHRYETGIGSVDAAKKSATVQKLVPIDDIQKELNQVFNGDTLSVGQTTDFVREFLGEDNFEENFGFNVDLRPGQTLNVSYELDVLGTLSGTDNANCQATYQTIKGTMDSIRAGGMYEYGVEDCRLCPPGVQCGKDLVDISMATNRSQKANLAYLKAKIHAFFTGQDVKGNPIPDKAFVGINTLGKETTVTDAQNYVEQINLSLGKIEEEVHANMFSGDPLEAIKARSVENQMKILVAHEEVRYLQMFPSDRLEWLPVAISKGFGIRVVAYWDGIIPVYSIPKKWINDKPWMIIDTGSLFWKEVCGLEKFFPAGHNSDKPRLTRYYKMVVFMNFQLPSLGDYSVYGKVIPKPQAETYATITKPVTAPAAK